MKTPRAPRVSVEITEQVIAESKLRDSSHCMIAEAVRASYPDAQRVAVDLQTIRFTDPKRGLRFTYLTPRVGQIALIQFDQGVHPEPFSMQLRGGQVTRAAQKTLKRSDLSPKQIQQRVNASKLSKARLVPARDNESVPDKIGGKTPPTTPFARRRAYGLRALER